MDDCKRTLLENDRAAWYERMWPFSERDLASHRYFSRVQRGSYIPWFRGIDQPRKRINFITRLKAGHTCTADHFLRMGWYRDFSCESGAELKDLPHILYSCPLLDSERPKLNDYFCAKFLQGDPSMIGINDLIFPPDHKVVATLGEFLCLGQGFVKSFLGSMPLLFSLGFVWSAFWLLCFNPFPTIHMLLRRLSLFIGTVEYAQIALGRSEGM